MEETGSCCNLQAKTCGGYTTAMFEGRATSPTVNCVSTICTRINRTSIRTYASGTNRNYGSHTHRCKSMRSTCGRRGNGTECVSLSAAYTSGRLAFDCWKAVNKDRSGRKNNIGKKTSMGVASERILINGSGDSSVVIVIVVVPVLLLLLQLRRRLPLPLLQQQILLLPTVALVVTIATDRGVSWLQAICSLL